MQSVPRTLHGPKGPPVSSRLLPALRRLSRDTRRETRGYLRHLPNLPSRDRLNGYGGTVARVAHSPPVRHPRRPPEDHRLLLFHRDPVRQMPTVCFDGVLSQLRTVHMRRVREGARAVGGARLPRGHQHRRGPRERSQDDTVENSSSFVP